MEQNESFVSCRRSDAGDLFLSPQSGTGSTTTPSPDRHSIGAFQPEQLEHHSENGAANGFPDEQNNIEFSPTAFVLQGHHQLPSGFGQESPITPNEEDQFEHHIISPDLGQGIRDAVEEEQWEADHPNASKDLSGSGIASRQSSVMEDSQNNSVLLQNDSNLDQLIVIDDRKDQREEQSGGSFLPAHGQETEMGVLDRTLLRMDSGELYNRSSEQSNKTIRNAHAVSDNANEQLNTSIDSIDELLARVHALGDNDPQSNTIRNARARVLNDNANEHHQVNGSAAMPTAKGMSRVYNRAAPSDQFRNGLHEYDANKRSSNGENGDVNGNAIQFQFEQKSVRDKFESISMQKQQEGVDGSCPPSNSALSEADRLELAATADGAKKAREIWLTQEKEKPKEVATAAKEQPRKVVAKLVFANLGANAAASSAPPSEQCPVCSKRVYAAEKMTCDGRVFHKLCFKCKTCGINLRLETSAVGPDNAVYCKNHHKEQFNNMQKNTYDGKSNKSVPLVVS